MLLRWQLQLDMDEAMKVLRRLFGVITLRSDIYREIVENANLWTEATLFIALAAIVNALSFALRDGFTSQSIVLLTTPFISWIVFGYVSAFLIKTLYKLDVPATDVIKIFGYIQLVSLPGLFLINLNLSNTPVRLLVSLLGYVLVFVSFLGDIIGVREAAQISTGRAVLIFPVLCGYPRRCLGLRIDNTGPILIPVR